MRGSHLAVCVADVATTRPASLAVFYRHNIDYSCNGSLPLNEACALAKVSPDALFDEIEKEESNHETTPVNWNSRPLVEVLHHLVTHYHEPERTALHHLVRLTSRVPPTKNDGTTSPVVEKLFHEVRVFADELIRHMAKEEQILFPWIASGRGSQAAAPIAAMLREHRDTVQTLVRMKKLTKHFQPLEDTDPLLTELCTQLAVFDREIREHIHLENNVLFPRALRETN